MERRWTDLGLRLEANNRAPQGLSKEPGWIDLGHRILVAYAEPRRGYHNLLHIEECLDLLATYRSEAKRPLEVELAIWFHDVVYVPGARDNERASACLAEDALPALGLPAPLVERVAGLIRSTDHLNPATREGESRPSGRDVNLLHDIDLAILGASPERFRSYEAGIRKEYGKVPWLQYQVGRRSVLRRFLKKPQLYRRQCLRDALEARARENLERALGPAWLRFLL